ncbi:MAG: hypothetical protein Tsb0015_00150 [Simkaniaceae bacterium]
MSIRTEINRGSNGVFISRLQSEEETETSSTKTDKLSVLEMKPLSTSSDFGAKKITKSELMEILKSAEKNDYLADLLQNKGYSLEISDISFDFNQGFKDLNLNGITFQNCNFDWPLFNNSNLDEVKFINSKLDNPCFLNSQINQSLFTDSVIIDGVFSGALLKETEFSRVTLINTNFEDAQITDGLFSKAAMPGTHFLQAEVKSTKIIQSDLTDTIFFGNEGSFSMDGPSAASMKITRPVTTILMIPGVRGLTVPKAYEKLKKDVDSIALRINAYPAKLDTKAVTKEVEGALKEISTDTERKKSLGEELMERANKDNKEDSIFRREILQKAEVISAHVDGILLPGGEDIPAKLYGKSDIEGEDWEIKDMGTDYRRSLLEFSLIKKSVSKGIPLIGLCRGFQISNIYFGSELTQHVDGHLMVRQDYTLLKEEDALGYFGSLDGKTFTSISAHHQAISKNNAPKSFLQPTIIFDDLIKAVEPKNPATAPLLAVQFHPELDRTYPHMMEAGTRREAEEVLEKSGQYEVFAKKISSDNSIIWTTYRQSVKSKRRKKQLAAAFEKK